MSSLYRQQLETWLKRIDVKCDSVLDVGGGQKSIKGRVKSWDVETYKVLDNDDQYKHDYFFDLNTYSETANPEIKFPPSHYFDVIFCLEVMEYIYDPISAHIHLSNFLKDDGIAYISYPTIYPLHNPPGIDYLRYTKNAIEKYLKEAGFKVWEVTPRIATNGVRSLSEFYSRERMRPMKGTQEIFDIGYMCKVYKGSKV